MAAAEPKRSPWLWIPTLYVAQGLPYALAMSVSVVLYKNLGISNGAITFWTSWLGLPWVIKPLWSPFVDITRTKRSWVVAMQFLISFGLVLAAFSLRGPWSLDLWSLHFYSLFLGPYFLFFRDRSDFA